MQNVQSTPAEAFVAFAQDVLSYVPQWLVTEDPPRKQVLAALADETTFNYRLKIEIDYDALLDEHLEFIHSLGSAKRCVQEHLSSDVFNIERVAHVTGGTLENVAQEQWGIEGYLIRRFIQPVKELVGRFHTPEMPDEQILETYQRYYASFHSIMRMWDGLSPVLNFVCDFNHEELLSPNIKVAPLLPEDRVSFWNALNPPYNAQMIDARLLIEAQYKLVSTRTEDLDAPRKGLLLSQNRSVIESIMDIVTALRLLKAGRMAVPYLFERSDINTPLASHVLFASGHDHGLSWPQFPPYHLKSDDLLMVRALAEALRRLREKKGWGGLEIALDRFRLSYGRETRDEDRIIDLTVALESSLLHGIKDELKHRLALRGVALLARTSHTDTNLLIQAKTSLQLMYDARSAIVHEGKELQDIVRDKEFYARLLKGAPGINDEPHAYIAGKFVDHCESVVRELLRAYVLLLAGESSIKHISTINGELDASLIDGLAVMYERPPSNSQDP